jgi:cation diffusion facilitator family transporter
MDRYPDAVQIPREIPEARANRYRELVRAAWKGVGVRLLIVSLELGGAALFSSASLFMSGLSTLLDMFSSLLLMASLRLAIRPPDLNHPFGHGRYEPLAGLQMGIFYILLGGGMLIYNILVFHEPHPDLLAENPVWILPFVNLLLLETCCRLLLRAAKKQNSPALAAEAYHYRIDSVSSALALLALGLAASLPAMGQFFDHLGGGAIAFFMMGVGVYAAKENLHQIMDHVPEYTYIDRIRKSAKKAKGVLGIEKLRVRFSGPDAHVDIDVEVEPQMPVKEAHLIAQQVRLEIQKEIPLVQDVIVHIEPYYPNDH